MEKHLKLGNISEGGFSLLEPGGLYNVGETIPGALEIETSRFELQAKVRHLDQKMAGLEFVKPSPDLVGAIENYLRLEFLALKLRSVDPEVLQKDPRGQVFWLTDGRQNEIYAVVGRRGLIEFHLSFLGHHVSANQDSPVRIGSMSESVSDSPGHKGSILIVETTVSTNDVLRLALVFVSNASDIPDRVRGLLIARLSSR